MADDWQPGDLARCVSTALGASEPGWESGIDGPKVGSFYVVADARYDQFKRIADGHFPEGVWLNFAQWPDDYFFAALFRKVRPIEADDFDREVIRALRGAPTPQPETAA